MVSMLASSGKIVGYTTDEPTIFPLEASMLTITLPMNP
jgi:hypothetical protein